MTGRVASGESASAFDRYTDITDPEEVQTLWERERKAATRWKYDGDSVVGMTQGDFQMFINKQLRQPELRRRFTAWLKDRIISDEVSRVKEEHAREHGAGKFDETEWLSSRDLDKVFSDHLKNLRDEGRSKDPLATKKETGFQFGSTLSRYLEEFLDLPRFASTSGKAEPAITPTTHPSAGLSYMRNKMYIENHPLLGPRAEPQPVRARVLSATPHILDIGGVVAEKRSGQPPRGGVDFNIEGGPKKYVVPKNAWVRPDGRIDIDIGDVKPDARSEEVIEEDRRWKEKNVPDYFKKRKVVQV